MSHHISVAPKKLAYGNADDRRNNLDRTLKHFRTKLEADGLFFAVKVHRHFLTPREKAKAKLKRAHQEDKRRRALRR